MIKKELQQELNRTKLVLDYARQEIEEKDKEIERLNKLISQREKKWEKWTTEKTILSTKMSDYLCKYQNIKREYTKQIKISTDRKKEIERLNNIINKKEQFLGDNIKRLEREVVKRDNIINELNNAYCKVITKCEEMINNRFYMNDIAIKKYANEIKDICKYYVGEAKRLKGDGSNE